MVYFLVYVRIIIVSDDFGKGHLNWFDSNSTIGLIFMLEDCSRGLSVRLVQRSNIMKNPSRCEDTRCIHGW